MPSEPATVPAAVKPGHESGHKVSGIYPLSSKAGWEGPRNRDESEDLPVMCGFAACGEQDADQTVPHNPSLRIVCCKIPGKYLLMNYIP
jgi:hypothetical protein